MELLLLIFGYILACVATGLFFYALFALLRRIGLADRFRHLTRILRLTRASDNPLLRPTHYQWESQAVMNPAAVKINGRTHLFYRAVGEDGVSRIGYAASNDGMHFDTRLPYAVFALRDMSEAKSVRLEEHPGLVASGGSWSGVEDPRAVVIEDRVHLSFSAFSGWDSLRIGTTSIAVDDLSAGRFKWSTPVFLSPIAEVHKNWVIFPALINGKYAVLHGFESRNKAAIAYLDSLDTEPNPPIKSSAAFRGQANEGDWDHKVRGSGPPPILTDKGWLLLYHANDAKEGHRYKLGALLLDRADPSKVIARAPVPVLAPDAPYENEGAKAHVIYACGALVEGDTLTVYYGGADTVVCAATTSLSKLLKKLKPV